jgi:dihydroorotase
MQSITIRRPDDWHVHLRDGAMLEAVARFTARQFARAIIMPNLSPPITTVQQAEAYRARIVAAAGGGFTPLMTAYLTDDSDPDEIERGHASGAWVAAKLYPAGATTNSASGVTDIANISAVLERMERIGMPLLVLAILRRGRSADAASADYAKVRPCHGTMWISHMPHRAHQS